MTSIARSAHSACKCQLHISLHDLISYSGCDPDNLTPCCAMLCYAMLCYAMLCYAMLCYAMLCYSMSCYAMLCYAVLCCAMLCYAVPCSFGSCVVMVSAGRGTAANQEGTEAAGRRGTGAAGVNGAANSRKGCLQVWCSRSLRQNQGVACCAHVVTNTGGGGAREGGGVALGQGQVSLQRE